MKIRVFSSALLLYACSAASFPVHAQEPIELPALRPANVYRAGEFIVDTLLGTRKDPFQSSVLTTKEAPPGSHIRLIYQAADTAIVEFGNIGTPPTERLITVLPMAPEKGDVLLPLYQSPYWSSHKRGIVLKLYSFIDSPVTVLGAAMEDRTSILSHFSVPLKHLLLRESFGATSVNYLFGYHVSAVRLTTILGILALLWIFVAVRVQKRPSTVALCAAFLPLLLLYEGRFLLDIAATTVDDQREWLTEGAYSEMGHLYQIADALQNDAAKAPDAVVATCDRNVTPLKYLMHPVPVETDKASWQRATHGIVLSMWDPDVKTVTCGTVTRGVDTVLAQFPSGTTVVSLDPPSS